MGGNPGSDVEGETERHVNCTIVQSRETKPTFSCDPGEPQSGAEMGRKARQELAQGAQQKVATGER